MAGRVPPSRPLWSPAWVWETTAFASSMQTLTCPGAIATPGSVADARCTGYSEGGRRPARFASDGLRHQRSRRPGVTGRRRRCQLAHRRVLSRQRGAALRRDDPFTPHTGTRRNGPPDTVLSARPWARARTPRTARWTASRMASSGASVVPPFTVMRPGDPEGHPRVAHPRHDRNAGSFASAPTARSPPPDDET
jgi:hypothetical protein